MKEQIHLFEVIKRKISDRQRLADVIEELLGVSSDSAYRRIRGETELTISELKIICDKFNLSMDEILNFKSNRGALFYYDPVNLMNNDVYINRAKRMWSVFHNLKSASDKEIVYTARSIPLYHLALFSDFAFLNLYTWNDVLDSANKSISYENFCSKLDKKNIIPMFQQLHNAQTSIPTKEIWTGQTINVTLRLLEYFYATGAFEKKETVLNLLDQLYLLMDTIHQYAEDGHMRGEQKTPFAMYNCSVDLYHNCMMARKGDQLSMTLRLHMANFLETDNEVLCNVMFKWQRGLISKSTQISGEASAKHRFHFFKFSKNKIDKLVEKIKKNKLV